MSFPIAYKILSISYKNLSKTTSNTIQRALKRSIGPFASPRWGMPAFNQGRVILLPSTLKAIISIGIQDALFLPFNS